MEMWQLKIFRKIRKDFDSEKLTTFGKFWRNCGHASIKFWQIVWKIYVLFSVAEKKSSEKYYGRKRNDHRFENSNINGRT